MPNLPSAADPCPPVTRRWGLCVAILSNLLLCGLYSLDLCAFQAEKESTTPQPRVRTEIPYQDGTLVLLSDHQERITQTLYRATGNVEILYQDMMITASEVDYDEASQEAVATGDTRFHQGTQWYRCTRAEFNFATETGRFYNVSGFTDNEFLIEGKTLYKVGPDTYTIDSGMITACQERTPKWSFRMSGAKIRIDGTAKLKHTIFRIKGIPVLYTPYVVLPLESKKRSSGFLPFHYGSSSSRGSSFSLGYFQTLGNSYDATVWGDYFTERGLAVGGIFRARPNEQTRMYIQAYGINDRLDQGGVHFIADADTELPHGFRGVATVNATTNFAFRQAFSDSFRTATVPEERSVLFLSGNQQSYSINGAFVRDEVVFPERSVVIRKSPALGFRILGQRLGRTPFIFELETSADGLSRKDQFVETPNIVQRLDLYPSFSVDLPSFAGFSLYPSLGFRQTYYSARLIEDPDPKVVPESLHRQLMTFTLDLRPPTIERSFDSSWFGRFKHTVEPLFTYRRINGSAHLREIIRFDELDPIAETNEIEYGLVNRIFRSRETSPGVFQQYEFLSFGLMQKYFFDPTFGGAFRPGESNIFYPLNTITGLALTSIQRRLAPSSLSLRVRPRPGFAFDLRGDYDSRLHGLRNLSLSSEWQKDKWFFGGTYFRTQTLEPGISKNNHIQTQVGYGSPNRGLSLHVAISYNIETSALLNSQTNFNYAWDCCGISLQYQQFDLGLRTESRISFSFNLKGIGNFGNIRRPEAYYY